VEFSIYYEPDIKYFFVSVHRNIKIVWLQYTTVATVIITR